MKVIKKILAGSFLTLGGFFWLVALLVPLSPLEPGQTVADRERENQSAILGCVVFGAPFVAGGGWLLWDLKKQHQTQQKNQERQQQEQLRQCLMELLAEGQGQVTLFEFAMRSGLEADRARAYLDRMSIEFGAEYQIGQQGETRYFFPTSHH
ncbi:MAG: hypothetical protein BJG00_013995 [Limnothrix sp. CACIAM 69d]|nr:MAG: hypothetical protein BJG00_013995 [Limnothrix sp. CACIAM 69d]